MRDYALIYLNGTRREIRGPEALLMLADWLRKEAGLTGTKIVCAEGDCGACTVLRALPSSEKSPLKFEAMNSCIATVAQMDGSHIVTVEGIQNGSDLSPVQKAMRECHGSQCGFCTPGFVMALSGALEHHQTLDEKTACNYLTGNLCRCTGYQPIIQAAIQAKAQDSHSVSKRYSKPAGILDLLNHRKQSLKLVSEKTLFFAPASLEEALQFVAENSGVRILGAATDIGVQLNKGKALPQFLLSLHLIPSLYEVEQLPDCFTVGARVTLSQLRRKIGKNQTEFARFLDLFASPQIKNVATLVGNIATGSPIGDTLPFLLVSEGEVCVAKWDLKRKAIVQRTVPFEKLYLGYRKLALEVDEVITHVTFRNPAPDQHLRIYKVSQRKDLDISTVSGAFSFRIQTSGKQKKIAQAKIALGGVAATPIRLSAIESQLTGKEITPELLSETAVQIGQSVKPLSDLRGTADYRRVLAQNLFKKYSLEVLSE